MRDKKMERFVWTTRVYQVTRSRSNRTLNQEICTNNRLASHADKLVLSYPFGMDNLVKQMTVGRAGQCASLGGKNWELHGWLAGNGLFPTSYFPCSRTESGKTVEALILGRQNWVFREIRYNGVFIFYFVWMVEQCGPINIKKSYTNSGGFKLFT